MKQTFKCQERMIYMAKNSARDNAIYLFRLMSAINRLAEYIDNAYVVDKWLDLRGRYGFFITEHPDFKGLEEEDPKLYEELLFIQTHPLRRSL